MRARLAVASAGIAVELREIVLRDKPKPFVDASPKGTVPVLQDGDRVIDESFDIMLWALAQNDPENWLNMPSYGFDLIAEAEGPFKSALDRYKYASRHEGVDIEAERHTAGLFLHRLDRMLDGRAFLFSEQPSLADLAILPFVRQFAHVNLDWFTDQPWHGVNTWLEDFKNSDRFLSIMTKCTPWIAGQDEEIFPIKNNRLRQ